MANTDPQRYRILAVDDDNLVVRSIRMALPTSWDLTHVDTPDGLPPQISSFDVAFVDLHLTGNLKRAEGVDVISQLRGADPRIEIVAMSGNLDQKLMEECLKNGASRFLAKPISPEELRSVLEKIEAWLQLQRAALRSLVPSVQWVGTSSASQQVRRQIASLKGENGPILIEGESGTGKEVAAHLIHQQEGRNPWIVANVAAIPENLFESELFGYMKGAFTGADQNRIGLAEAAQGGDLFLDEIEALSLPLQAKLLRFLESGEIRRVGSKDPIKLQVRLIAATNQNLETMVKEGKFREDLLWRLNGKKIVLPPLRDRRDDIGELAQFFVSQERPRRFRTLLPESIEILKKHSWPGNVRELRRIVEQISLQCPLPLIRPTDVESVLRPKAQGKIGEESINLSLGLTELMNRHEKLILMEAFRLTPDVDQCAEVLKISRSNLYKKLRDYDVTPEKSKSE